MDSWRPVLDGALDLFKRTEEKSIRLVVGKHTIVVQKENEETVAVVLPTGHAIAKSLRRMIRRMARKDRGPLPKAKLEELAARSGRPTAPVTPSAQPTTAPPAPAPAPAQPTTNVAPPPVPAAAPEPEAPAAPTPAPSTSSGPTGGGITSF
ncbi:hypothetical protein PPSIR1_31108 [Plesiocystis pacifica SIR-1]|uniref:Uncharacterized protein n=1 Tax=Plesiocystis pacifica SIR-1 TaxID=391625 RepID=A6GH17_9BACT|nr:hypothetical protein [Plesiocystis pacifica]EDM74849.1 hypothetical protein PPSIR1_31108 [Plesiocystis pacifica SIR-1]